MPGYRSLLAATWCLLMLAPATARSSGATAPDPRLRDAWRWSHFTRASGLPSDFVLSVVEVPGDGLWALTREGVARFDGFVWRKMTAPGAPATEFVCIAQDGQGGVVAVGAGHLLAGSASGLSLVPYSESGRPVPFRGCGRAATGHALLLATHGVLYEWDGRSVVPHPAPRDLGRVHVLVQGGPTSVWVSAESGLWCWDGGRWRRRLEGRDLLLYAAAELPDESALAFVDAPQAVRGLWEWEGESEPRPIRRSVQTAVHALALSPSGETAIVYNTGDVMLRTGEGWTPLPGPAAAATEARGVGFLPGGDLWVATDRGLFLHRRAPDHWRVHSLPYPDDRNTINAIAALGDGRMLLGTASGVVVTGLQGPAAGWQQAGADLGAVTGLAVDSQGRAWATSGYSFKGARWRDPAGTWRTARLHDELDAAYVHRVTRDSRGGLWFLALSGAPTKPPDRFADGPGAFRVTFSAGSTPVGVERWGPAQGLPSGRVYDFAEGPDGAYWFATAGGLSRWHRGRWKTWTTREGLLADRVFCVEVSRAGDAWFGHQGWLGVGRVRGEKVDYFTEANGLATDAVWEIAIDDRDRPWAAGEGGVSVFEDGGWTAIGAEGGLTHTRFWPVFPAGRRMFFGSRGGGLVELDLGVPGAPPPVVVADPPAVSDSGLLVRWRTFAWWGEVAPGAVLTRVRLDGGRWTPWSVDRQQIFHDVAPGRHTVAFEAKGLLGSVARNIAPLHVTVPPPLVRRPVFFVPVGALTVAVVGLLITLGVRQRRHHRDLHAREEQLSRTFQASPLATALTRLDDGRLLEVNRTLLVLSGKTRAELIGKTPVEAGIAVEEYGRERLVAALEQGQAIPPLTVRARDARGEVHEMLAYSDAVEYGGTRAILTHLLDVSEQRRLESQLRHSQKMESIGRLAGGVAHDFNNLLTVIVGNASLLEMELPEGDPRLAEIEQIKIAGERAERLTRQLLAFARRQMVEPKVININDVVMATDRMLRRLIGEDIELVTLPGADLDDVLIDPSQLDQVIVNMAVNARDAMPDGGTLTIRTHRAVVDERDTRLQPQAMPGRWVRLSISDTGTGMDAATQARLFEPFFTTKEPGKGTGLGLATCYGVVRQAGGQILVESAIGRGSTFHVDLPPAPPGRQPGEARERALDTKGGAETILLVEDEVQVRKLAAQVLRQRGYEVIEAGTGTEALQVYGGYRGHVDVLVTDVVMPQMRGTELASRLRASRPDLKVLYVSGYTDDDVFRQEAGADRLAFLVKPFTPAALARKVREILDSSS